MNKQGNKLSYLPVVAITVIFVFAAMQTIAGEQQAGTYKTAKRYDMSGRLTGTISPDPDGAGPLAFPATRFIFDSTRGLLLRSETGELPSWLDEDIKPEDWDSYGFEILVSKVYTYDDYGRKKTEALVGENGATENLTQYAYDSNSRVLCSTRRMNPNAFGSLPSSACTLGTEGTFGPDRITRYTYTDLDQVLTERRATGTSLSQLYVTNTWEGLLLKTVTDANGNKTELRYDDYGRLERRVYPSKTTPGSLNESDYNAYDYDANGNMDWERKRSGVVFTYAYDNNNRMTQKNGPGTLLDVKYDYDLRGLTRSSLFISNNQGVTNVFNAFGDLDSSNTNMLGQSRTLSYLYNKNGSRTRITHTDGKYFTYGFDYLNRVKSVSESTSTTLLTVNYRENGSRKDLVRTGGATTTYNFDNAHRLDSLVQNVSGTTYDVTNSFDYNPAGQMTLMVRNNTQYAYVGNNNLTGSYTPNGLNQYTNINGQAIAYDTKGNLNSDGNQTYTYDDENRLVTVSGANSAAFVYDPLGRLFQVTVNGTARQFLYDGDALVAEYTTANAMQRRYVHGDRVDEPWVQYNSGNVGTSYRRYLHADHQGSIIAHSSGSAAVSNVLAYDSFGIPKSTNIDRFAYTGQIWFPELGLFHYKARIYSPTLGRFLQTDPIFYEDQMNMYAYVGNDPVNMVDSSGRQSEDVILEETINRGFFPPPESSNCGCFKLTGEAARRFANQMANSMEIAARGIATMNPWYMMAMSSKSSGSGGAESGSDSSGGGAGSPDPEDDENDKQKNRTPGNNQAQNKQFKDATRGLTKAQQRMVHEEITGQNLSYQEIKAIAEAVKNGTF